MSRFSFGLAKISEGEDNIIQNSFFTGVVTVRDKDGVTVASTGSNLPTNTKKVVNNLDGTYYVDGLSTGRYSIYTNNSKQDELYNLAHAGDDLIDYLTNYEGTETTLADILNALRTGQSSALTTDDLKTDFDTAANTDALAKIAIAKKLSELQASGLSDRQVLLVDYGTSSESEHTETTSAGTTIFTIPFYFTGNETNLKVDWFSRHSDGLEARVEIDLNIPSVASKAIGWSESSYNQHSLTYTSTDLTNGVSGTVYLLTIKIKNVTGSGTAYFKSFYAQKW